MTDKLGQSVNMTVLEAIHYLESQISEGLDTPMRSSFEEADQQKNVFGRHPLTAENTIQSLSFIAGLSLAGLRVAAFTDGCALANSRDQLTSAARRHLSYLLHLNLSTGHSLYHALSGTGCFQLFAADIQETVDLCLIAHKIAELSLIPGINAVDCVQTDAKSVLFPDQAMITAFLGDPDDQISCPTPSQQMIFGQIRRRIPNWFSFDYPTMNGALKDPQSLTFEIAAQQPYFYDHLLELAHQVMSEYSQLSGRTYAPVSGYHLEDAQYVILAQGSAINPIISAVDELRSTRKIKVGCLKLTMFRPFPGKLLSQLIAGKKAVMVLEQISAPLAEDPPVFCELSTTLEKHNERKKGPLLYCGYYGMGGMPVTKERIITCFENMLPGGQSKDRFFLGVDFAHQTSAYPKQEILFQNIHRAYPKINTLSLPVPTTENEAHVGHFDASEMPLAVRQYKDHGPPYSRLSHFFDQVSYFYQTKQQNQLVADPFQAVPVVPTLSASCHDMSHERTEIPEFIPTNCTGCGQCFIYCPHSAIPALVIHLELLLKEAIKMTTTQGMKTASLTPAIKNLARLANQMLKQAEEPITKIADFLPGAFDKLVEQMKIEGERLADFQTAFDHILGAISKLPVAVTDLFFEEPEKQQKGLGEVFSLFIDPQVCTGCLLCANVCTEDALVMVPQTTEALSSLRSNFRLWEALPDTAVETVRRVHQEADYPSLASILLYRNFYMTMAGGNYDNHRISEKTILHLVSAITESVMQPLVMAQAGTIKQLIEQIAATIHAQLVKALPSENFQNLSEAISQMSSQKVPFATLINALDDHPDQAKNMDLVVLQRRVDLIQSLQDLYWALTEGPTGVGRARLGMTMASSSTTDWARQFPQNPFCFPMVIQWEHDNLDLILGLFQGHLRHFLDNIRLIRRAQLEAEGKYDPGFHDPQIAALDWNELTDQEWAILPPVFLVGSSDSLVNHNLSSLSNLLTSRWPVKIIVFNTDEAKHDSPEVYASNVSKPTLLAMAHRHAFVLQASLASFEHFFSGIVEGIKTRRPALFYLYAPHSEPKEETINTWPVQAELALHSRSFPAVCFNPEKPGVFGTSLDLEGNPQPENDWISQELPFFEEEQEQTITYATTFADWAFTQKQFKPHFTPISAEDVSSIPVAEYLCLDETARKGKTPFIFSVDPEKNLQKYAVSGEIIHACESILATWQTLQELGGTVTPFTKEVRQQVENELMAEHQAEIEQLKMEYEQKLQQQKEELMQTMQQQLTEKLLVLSGYKNSTYA